jgi:hypothetical protein
VGSSREMILIAVEREDIERGDTALICDLFERLQVSDERAPMGQWIGRHFLWLNEITDRLLLPEEENKRITFEVMRALFPDFEVPADA